MTTHVACIGTARDVVPGEYCDLNITEAVIGGYRLNGDGDEIPEYMGGDKTVYTAELATRVDDEEGRIGVADEADEALKNAGWVREGEWETSENALYAPVRAS